MADARVAIRLVLAGVLLVGVVVVVGPDRMFTALSAVHPGLYALALVGQLMALSLWGLSLAALLRHVDGAPLGGAFAGAYCTGLLLRMLVPWGRSGGAVFTAVALSRASTTPIERLLAVALAADLVRFLISIGLVLSGVALVSGATVSSGVVPLVALLVVGLGVAGVALLVLLRPVMVTQAVVVVAAMVGRVVGRVSPTVASALDPVAVRDRTHRFFDTVHTLLQHRRALVRSVSYATVGWIAALLPLYFTVEAAGAGVSLPVVMFIVPAAGLAGIAPLPGGTGGVEVALVGLLTVVAGMDVAVAGVVTVLYRVATFWFGLAVSAVGAVTLTGERGTVLGSGV